MTFVETNYVTRTTGVTMDECRVYETDCNDQHFSDIIHENKDWLRDKFRESNELYILMDNVYVRNEFNSYASISFITRRRGDDTIYQIGLITNEGGVSHEVLKEFLLKVFEKVSWEEQIRIAFTSDPLETTYRVDEIGNRELCFNNLMEELGIKNEHNEQPN